MFLKKHWGKNNFTMMLHQKIDIKTKGSDIINERIGVRALSLTLSMGKITCNNFANFKYFLKIKVYLERVYKGNKSSARKLHT